MPKTYLWSLIDEGWTLSWGVECETTIPMSSETYTVVSGLYHHVENSIKWENWYKEGDDLSNEKLSYQFYFSRTEGVRYEYNQRYIE